jgi:hypothetical protein
LRDWLRSDCHLAPTLSRCDAVDAAANHMPCAWPQVSGHEPWLGLRRRLVHGPRHLWRAGDLAAPSRCASGADDTSAQRRARRGLDLHPLVRAQHPRVAEPDQRLETREGVHPAGEGVAECAHMPAGVHLVGRRLPDAVASRLQVRQPHGDACAGRCMMPKREARCHGGSRVVLCCAIHTMWCITLCVNLCAVRRCQLPARASGASSQSCLVGVQTCQRPVRRANKTLPAA